MTHNKHRHVFLMAILLWALLSSSCRATVESPVSEPEQANPTPTAASDVTVTEAAPAATIMATEAAPTATATPAPRATDVTDDEEALSDHHTLGEAGIGLDLASPLIESVTVETVPVFEQVPDRGPRHLAQPAHSILYLAGYPECGNYRRPQIVIYPVEAYMRLTLQAERQVEQLQVLLASGAGAAPGMEDLPYLPAPNAVQILHARTKRLAFQNGEGIRYLTQYVQDVSPIVSSSLFYTFQGLTADGQFWISAVLPVASDALPQDIATAQEQGFDGFAFNFDHAGYEAYLAEQQALIEDLPDEGFAPHLATLDTLVQSLDLSAYRGPNVEPWAPDVAPAPDQVLDAFLDAYLPAGGFPAGAHVSNAHLQPEFVAQVEETVAAYREAGIEAADYDPILMSVLGPAGVGDAGYGFKYLAIGPASYGQQTATVPVERHWHYTKAVSPLNFSFAWNGERWQISDVTSIMPATPPAPQEAPVAVTEQFLSLMTASTSQFDFIDEWLRDVSPDVVLPNAALALCNQSWPMAFAIEGSFSQPAPLTSSTMAEEEAYVVVHLPSPGSLLTTRLVRQGDVWRVADVICGDTPQGRALAFYAWYLGIARDAGETRWAERAPNMDRMNPGQSFVTERFLRDAQLRFQEDLYLPSARVPDRFVVRPGAQEHIVLVDLQYLGESEATVETLQLTLERVGEVWLVDSVEVAGEG